MRIAYRLISFCVALSLAATPTYVWGATPAEEVESLYADGDTSFSNGDYVGAARTWAEALDLMEETEDNNATRAQILVSALTAYMEAFIETRKVDHLRAAARLLERYAHSLERAYDGEASLSEAIVDMKRRLERALEGTQAKTGNGNGSGNHAVAPNHSEPATPGQADPNQGSTANKRTGPPAATGRGLLIAGVASTAASLGTGSLIAIGIIQGIAANDKLEDGSERPAPEQKQIKSDGERANKMAVVGAIITPVLLGAGVAMLIIGGRRNSSHLSVTPTVNDSFVGLSLSGRF
ncbi:MAG: hypothetical protein V3V08_05225 [Nannocystaceae bacterium]